VIDRGRADRLQPGMRFEVYDASLATASSLPRRGKAAAVVDAMLGDRSALCRLVEATADWPVRVGDVTASQVYEPGVRRRYYVSGAFDLDGDGTFEITQADRVGQAVALLAGGDVVRSVADAQVVVLGREPGPYLRPPSGAEHAVHQGLEKWVAGRIEDYRHAAATAKERALPVLDQQWVQRALGYPPHPRYPPVPRRSLRIDSGGGKLRLLWWSGVDWRERRPRWLLEWTRPAVPGPIPPAWALAPSLAPALAPAGPQSFWRRAGFALDYASVPSSAPGAPTGYPVKGRETLWAVTAPQCAATGVLALLPLAWLARTARRSARAWRARGSFCEGCGYDLRGSPARCPECGLPVARAPDQGAK
jgi:hypothetical protein